MNNIEKIEIRIISITRSIEILIIPETLKVYAKEKVSDISPEKIKELLKIICTWEKEYIDKKNIDSEKYIVKIYEKNNIDEYCGNGKYPLNYKSFVDKVEELYASTI